jgi:hypothetical protein
MVLTMEVNYLIWIDEPFQRVVHETLILERALDDQYMSMTENFTECA